MKENPPGPSTRVFGGVAIGVANAIDAAIPSAISTGFGSHPIVWAMEIPIGASSAAEAVLDMNWVSTLEIRNNTAVRRYGFGLSPIAPTTVSAINLPAPVLSIAVATESMPAKRKIVTQSIPA